MIKIYNFFSLILKGFLLMALLMSCSTLTAQHSDNINDRDVLYLTTGGKLNPLQAIMDIRHYTLALEVDMTHRSISGSAEVSLLLSQATDTLLLDLIHLYAVSKVTVNNSVVGV